MKAILKAGAILVFTLSASLSHATPVKMSWDDLRFLIGEWEAIGQGKPDEAKGGFSFAFDLQGKIIVRRNYAEYPAMAGRPAAKHEDFMVIYADDTSDQTRASYFDSEGHVINYKVELSADHQVVTFLSDPLPSKPQYRLTYTKLKDGTLGGKFEIAPPGQPEAFKNYLEWVSRKR
ncbi:MAG TPA: hypothetical protein VGC91_14125 [Pyrinomonadaceae bacterium]